MFDFYLIDDNLQQLLINLVAERTGLKIRDSEQENFRQKIQSRIKSLGLSQPKMYYNLLNKLDQESKNEWHHLVTLITNTESYFFRDQGQFLLLKEHILPELIERQKNSKTLKIWSAGCSTGEEPYSLAILLQELIVDIEQWHIQLLGTDLNQNALKRAKQGIYSSWSFRSLEQNTIHKYFEKVHNDYQINPQIRAMTQFDLLNLKSDHFPQEIGLIHHIDLIVCRNVFIYFSKENITIVLDKFLQSLNPLGYLLTGHAELYGQNLSNFETKIYSESIVYQKMEKVITPKPNKAYLNQPFPDLVVDQPTSDTLTLKQGSLDFMKTNPPINQFNRQKSSSFPSQNSLNFLSNKSHQVNKTGNFDSSELHLLSIAESQFKQKQYQGAIESVNKALSLHPHSLPAYYLKAKILANMGQYEEAKKYCQKIITLDSFYLQAYYLLAQIAEEDHHFEEAKNILKKIIYLDHNAVNAYLSMAYLYRQESNGEKSKKMYQIALELVQKLPPDVMIEGHHLTAKEIGLQIEKDLAMLEE